MARNWRQQNALNSRRFRRIFDSQFTPAFTLGSEILMEDSDVYTQNYLVTEARIDPNTLIHTYIIAEHI